jgi:hypothetical protein
MSQDVLRLTFDLGRYITVGDSDKMKINEPKQIEEN